MSKKLPRGLTFDEKRQQYRVRFTSRHTAAGRLYREWLPAPTNRRQAETYLAMLLEQDRQMQLVWPQEREREQIFSVGEFASEIYLPHARARNKPKTIRFKEQRLLSLSSFFGKLFSMPLLPQRSFSFKQPKENADSVRARSTQIPRHLAIFSHLPMSWAIFRYRPPRCRDSKKRIEKSVVR